MAARCARLKSHSGRLAASVSRYRSLCVVGEGRASYRSYTRAGEVVCPTRPASAPMRHYGGRDAMYRSRLVRLSVCEMHAAGQVDLDVEMLARCARLGVHALRALATDWYIYVGDFCTLDRTAILSLALMPISRPIGSSILSCCAGQPCFGVARQRK